MLGRGVPAGLEGEVAPAVLPVVPVARGVPEPAAGITTVGSVGPVPAVDAADPEDAVDDGFGGGGEPAGRGVEGFVPGRWRRRLDLLTWLPRCVGKMVVWSGSGVARRTTRVRALGEGTVPRLNRAHGSLR